MKLKKVLETRKVALNHHIKRLRREARKVVEEKAGTFYLDSFSMQELIKDLDKLSKEMKALEIEDNLLYSMQGFIEDYIKEEE